ncbi:MAG TPA: hypothetical protein VKX45_01420 [Bryobacteraceae bacterium]|jgi:uncharacterized protein (TIGR03437 family)|nr:hypothetical protein [Bryobacteraceae bacterium]
MSHFIYRAAILFTLLIAGTIAQDLGTATVIDTVPDGLTFYVDGSPYNSSLSVVWPVGSKHVLSVPPDIQQDPLTVKTKFSFVNWQYSGNPIPGGTTVTITAGPPFTKIEAVYSVQYALTLNYFNCNGSNPCNASGIVYVNGAPYTGNQDIYMAAGSQVHLMAVPNPGFVFVGWVTGSSGANQSIQGALNTVTMNGPIIVAPQFSVARPVTLATLPPGLNVVADRAQISTPNTYDWGWDTVHSVGVISPQQDVTHNWWVFSSWSDGGAASHAYTVAEASAPDTLTATFVPAAVVPLSTSPPGLTLIVDGRSNWANYNFVWSSGETHQIEAPAQQTDSKGRVWAFSSWSNGGARAQSYTVPALSSIQGLVATYTPMAHLTISSPVSGLAVQVDGATCSIPCDVVRPVGATVQLGAPASFAGNDANSRYDFDGWPGSGSFAPNWSLTLGPDPVSLNLTYHLMNRLITSSAPPDGASWQLQPSSPDGFYSAPTNVAISVTAMPGFRFRNFSGDLGGSSPSGTVAMNAPRQVQAILDKVPFIAPAGVSNAAGATPQSAVAPGSIISIFGASLANTQVTGPSNPMLQALDCSTVQVGGRLLPLFFVSPTQINAQLPDDMQPGAANLTVSCTGLPDVQASFTVARNAPGLFQQPSNNVNFAVASHEDGSPVTAGSAARSGELLSLYGTGFGPADHTRPEGFPVPATPPYLLLDTATVNAGGVAIPAVNAFAAPGTVGLDVIQFRLGDGVPSGTNVQVYVTINGQNSNTVVLPVQ